MHNQTLFVHTLVHTSHLNELVRSKSRLLIFLVINYPSKEILTNQNITIISLS